jgi:hypothetical protein
MEATSISKTKDVGDFDSNNFGRRQRSQFRKLLTAAIPKTTDGGDLDSENYKTADDGDLNFDSNGRQRPRFRKYG